MLAQAMAAICIERESVGGNGGTKEGHKQGS